VRDQLHAAIDVIIEVGRGRDGRRHVTSVVEVAEPGDSGPRVRVVADDRGIVGELRRDSR
jgi:hypothetical protein